MLLKPTHVLAGRVANVVNRVDFSGADIRMDARTEQPSVADEAYSRLRSDILGGELLPGRNHKLSKAEELVVQDADQHADLLETYNREFHGALISGCNSRWLLHFHGLMYDQSLRYRMLAFRVKDFPRDQSRREHKQILDAALARDVDTLEAVLGTHITKGAEMYAEHEAGAQGRGRARRKVR